MSTRFRFLAVGKPRLAFARLGAEEYEEKLKSFTKIDIEYLRDGPKLLDQTLVRSAGFYRIALHENGEALSSTQLADRLASLFLKGHPAVAVLVGGAEGHAAGLLAACDWRWSLGPATLQHELALVVALEQIYRALAIHANHPYHREGPRTGRE